MDSDDVPSDVHDGWQWRQTSKDSACAPPFPASCVACGNGGAVMETTEHQSRTLKSAAEYERDTWRERAETAQECAARAEAERATMADRLAQLDIELSSVRRELKAAQCAADEAHENAKRWREECARAWLHVSEAAAERAKELGDDDDG